MTESDWDSCTDPRLMLELLRNCGNASERKLRLFACACCRSIWHLMTDKCSRRAVEVAERFADGQATPQTLRKWHLAAFEAFEFTQEEDRLDSAYAAYCAAHEDAATAAFGVSETVTEALQCDIIANPFRVASPIDKTWLLWNDEIIPRLAWAIYEERSLPAGMMDTDRLAILADAMEEAGCTEADILNHCRKPGEHVRGCWVVDLLLGKS